MPLLILNYRQMMTMNMTRILTKQLKMLKTKRLHTIKKYVFLLDIRNIKTEYRRFFYDVSMLLMVFVSIIILLVVVICIWLYRINQNNSGLLIMNFLNHAMNSTNIVSNFKRQLDVLFHWIKIL